MDKEQLITALQLIVNDVRENHAAYDMVKLTEIVSQFQRKVLALRHKDQKIDETLQSLSSNDLKQVIDEVHLCLLSVPDQKAKLVALLNSLILQEGKETQLLQMINKFNFLRTSFKKDSTDDIVVREITPENIDEVRKEWLAHDSPDDLFKEMDRMSVKDLRAITKPWKLKSRSKDGLIELTIDYLNKNK